MTSRLRARTHDYYRPGEYNPRHDPDFAETVLFRLLGDEPPLVVGTGWQRHVSQSLGVDCTSLKDAVNQLRRGKWQFVIEGDRSRGYRITGVKRWRRGGGDE